MLPTEPGSVIARMHSSKGVRIAALNAAFDLETGEPDGHYWALLGVIPPGNDKTTKEQCRAKDALISDL